jgi:integrase/recombinase XerD
MNDLRAPAPALQAAPQASSDDELVRLFLGTYGSANTRRAYAGDVSAFRTFVGMPLARVTLGDVQAYAATLVDMAPASAARRLSAVKKLTGFGLKLGYLQFNTAAPVPLPKIKDTLIERLMSEEQVLTMLAAVKRPRDAALLRLIYGAGLRVSEACGLRWRDVTPRDEAGQINVFGKGGKTRIVLLPQRLWDRLVALRASAGPDDPVFRSRKAGALQRGQVHLIVKAAAKRARLSPSISTHWLRHAHASHALDRGAPVHVVQTTLGHASLTTTTRYTHARPGDSSARYLSA